MLNEVNVLGHEQMNKGHEKKRKIKGSTSSRTRGNGADGAHQNHSPEVLGQRWFELKCEQPGGEWGVGVEGKWPWRCGD